MKTCKLIAAVMTVFFLLTTGSALAETDAERLDRMEKEIEDLKADKAREESVWSKYDMRLYGRVKVDLNYDTAEFEKYNDFIGCVKKDGTTDSVNFNPRDTRFGFEASHATGNWTGKGRFEIDFYGDNNGDNLIPRMRLGYVDMANSATDTNVLVGQDWVPVAQQMPDTVDFGVLTAAGNLWWRIPQVTVRQQLGNTELLVSAMMHRRIDTDSAERMPWALARVAYNFGEAGFVAAGGGYQSNEYRYTAADGKDIHTGKDIDRSLVALELKLSLGPVGLKAEGFWGEGLDKDFLRYDMGVNDTDPNNPKAIEAMGGFVSLTANVTDKVRLAVGYGIDDPRNDDMKGMEGNLNARQFTQNQQAFVNSWYQLTEGINVGAEVVYVKTERFEHTDEGMRYTLSTFYSF
jgi:hypothetical protein